MTFIQLPDLIINANCIATAKLSSYPVPAMKQDIPIVSICLMLPEYSMDGEGALEPRHFYSVEKLEFEGELALEIWEQLVALGTVKVLSG